MTRRLLSDGAPPPDLSLLFAKVFRKLSLNFSTGELGHSLRTFHRADTIGPSTGEDNVHLFQTSALWFGEQEVDGRDQSGVQDRKDDICPPCRARLVVGLQVEKLIPLTLKVGKGRWRDHDDDEVAEPIEDSRNGVRVDTSAQICKFSWQQPSHS
jgi:hypothetical protein